MKTLCKVCLKEDEYSKELYYSGARWIVHLSNSTDVIQDDGRPGLEWSAWKRLREYVYENDLSITGLSIQFRTNKIKILGEASGFFFCNSIAACLNSDDRFHYFILGKVENDVVITQKWLVPLMIHVENGVRKVQEALDCVIFNDSRRKTIPTCPSKS